MIMTNSEIILCSGIKMDKNYENVLSLNEQGMVNLCRNNAIYQGNNYKIIGVRENVINVSAKYEDCIYANYLAFINKKYGNKWFFGWVTDVKLLNPETTQITYKIDVFSTWYSRFVLNQAFIEREHVSDDTIGKHTIPEGLEMGEYTLNLPNETDISIGSNSYVIIALSDWPFPVAVPSGVKQYGGVFSGLWYVAFENGEDAEHFIRVMQDYITEDIITTMFIIPRSLLQNPSFQTVTFDSKSIRYYFVPFTSDDVFLGFQTTDKPTTLDGYTPKNNKLKVFPFQYLLIDNNAGSSHIYHYEDWQDTVDDKCDFTISGVISPGCAIKMYPANYKSKSINYIEGIDAPKLPTCGWINDAYTNWLTQNAVNIPLGIATDAIKAIGGSIAGNVGVASSGFLGIAGSVAQIYEKSLTPLTAKGGVNQGDLTFAKRLGWNLYHYSIRKEYCAVIDAYFSRFGYKVNEVKTPNLNSRSKFNFIKVGGMDELVSGNIPANALEEINGIFRKGVTIFHSYNDIGNYTINNPIVTP